MEIKDKVGLITGRADGMSKSFAEALLKKGAKVTQNQTFIIIINSYRTLCVLIVAVALYC